MRKMGLREDASRSCGEAKQTSEHVATFCPDAMCHGDFLASDKAATEWLTKRTLLHKTVVKNCIRANEQGIQGKQSEMTI